MSPASSNWLALKKTVSGTKRKSDGDASTNDERPVVTKRRRIDYTAPPTSASASKVDLGTQPALPIESRDDASIDALAVANLPKNRNGESLHALRQMVLGKATTTEAQRQPGKYLALDCEMVGVGPEGAESSLARVSIVNFYGVIQLDVFVRQRERVVDYRTKFSGIRPKDMVNARPFDEVQKEVAELLKDNILIGHALQNDTKALLLSHPRPLTRDTQYYAWKSKLIKSNRSALRVLIRQELGLVIQSGEHSSVTDARATMALYRLHRKQWEKLAPPPLVVKPKNSQPSEAEGTPNEKFAPSDGGRKGISSGLSVVVTKAGGKTIEGRKRSQSFGGEGKKTKAEWWKELGSTSTKGPKGSVRMKA